MRNALCLEAFGTFFLCLAVAVAGEPLAVAAVLGALIYAGGPISGAHYNPAATLAWCVRGRHRWLPGVAYVLVQLTAALAAAAVAGLLAAADNREGSGPDFTVLSAFDFHIDGLTDKPNLLTDKGIKQLALGARVDLENLTVRF